MKYHVTTMEHKKTGVMEIKKKSFLTNFLKKNWEI